MDRNAEKVFGGLEDILEVKYIHDGSMLAEIDAFKYKGNDHDATAPLFSGVIGFIVILRGTMDINIHHKMHHCTSSDKNIIELRATYSIYEMYISQDFRGYILGLNRSFAINNMGFMRASGRVDSFFIPEKPYFTATSQDKQLIMSTLTRIESNMLREDHRFFSEIVTLTVIEAFLELINIVYDKALSKQNSERSVRRDELCHNFMNHLSEFGRTEHSVSFYADKLCITPQYLTKVLKKELGMSANKLIDINLVTEATKMLQSKGTTIADIVEQLNFADQASFNKFFRKHTNTTPARFRKFRQRVTE